MVDRISDKWVTLVISALADGPQRYSDLSRRIAGVTQTYERHEASWLLLQRLPEEDRPAGADSVTVRLHVPVTRVVGDILGHQLVRVEAYRGPPGLPRLFFREPQQR